MKQSSHGLTVADVQRCWFVDATGTVRWKQSVGAVRNCHLYLFNGTVAGTLTKTKPSGLTYRVIGYTVIGVKYFLSAHIIAYTLHNGRFPEGDVDHIDGNGLNNTGTNLRDTTRRVNLCNAKLNVRSTTGIKGVTPVKGYPGKYHAQVRVNGNHTHLYIGDDFFLACCARKSFEARNDADRAYSGRGNLRGG